MDSVFYNSGDPEFESPLGSLIAQNTNISNEYNLSYS